MPSGIGASIELVSPVPGTPDGFPSNGGKLESAGLGVPDAAPAPALAAHAATIETSITPQVIPIRPRPARVDMIAPF